MMIKNKTGFQPIRIILFIFAILTLPCQGFSANPEKAVIGKVTLNNTRDDLIIFYNVENAFNEKVVERIESGAETIFTYRIVMKQVINFRKDKKIQDLTHTHSIKFNNLKKEYTIYRSWTGEKPVVTKSFKEAQNDRDQGIKNCLLK